MPHQSAKKKLSPTSHTYKYDDIEATESEVSTSSSDDLAPLRPRRHLRQTEPPSSPTPVTSEEDSDDEYIPLDELLKQEFGDNALKEMTEDTVDEKPIKLAVGLAPRMERPPSVAPKITRPEPYPVTHQTTISTRPNHQKIPLIPQPRIQQATRQAAETTQTPLTSIQPTLTQSPQPTATRKATKTEQRELVRGRFNDTYDSIGLIGLARFRAEEADAEVEAEIKEEASNKAPSYTPAPTQLSKSYVSSDSSDDDDHKIPLKTIIEQLEQQPLAPAPAPVRQTPTDTGSAYTEDDVDSVESFPAEVKSFYASELQSGPRAFSPRSSMMRSQHQTKNPNAQPQQAKGIATAGLVTHHYQPPSSRPTATIIDTRKVKGEVMRLKQTLTKSFTDSWFGRSFLK